MPQHPIPDTQQLKRPVYWPRQMVTAQDLNAGSDYMVERMRRHNRHLHGCGIVCGLELDPVTVNYDIGNQRLQLGLQVTAGAAISPQGDLITVPEMLNMNELDVARKSLAASGSPNIRLFDLFASQQGLDVSVHVLLRHLSTESREHVQARVPPRCKSADIGLVSTRHVDGYEVALSIDLPTAYISQAASACGDVLNDLLRVDSPMQGAALARLMHCPPLTDNPWLVLATIVLKRNGNSVPQPVVHYRNRSFVPSARLMLELMHCLPEAPRIDTISTKLLRPGGGGRYYLATVTGYGFTPFQRIVIDEPLLVPLGTQATERQLTFTYFLRGSVPPGPRAVRIVTDFDEVDSARCGAYLEIQQPSRSAYPYHYGYATDLAIGGGLV